MSMVLDHFNAIIHALKLNWLLLTWFLLFFLFLLLHEVLGVETTLGFVCHHFSSRMLCNLFLCVRPLSLVDIQLFCHSIEPLIPLSGFFHCISLHESLVVILDNLTLMAI